MYSVTPTDVVQEYLLKECRELRVVSQLEPATLPQVQVSCFGVIGKKNFHWHLIIDLSVPQPNNFNDGRNLEWCSTLYVKVEDAARAI